MDWNALTLFLMITGRMTGMIVFNPLLGRRGVPGLVKGGLALLLSISVYAITPSGPEMPATVLGLALTFLMELFLGYVLGLVVNIFFYIPIMAGSVIVQPQVNHNHQQGGNQPAAHNERNRRANNRCQHIQNCCYYPFLFFRIIQFFLYCLAFLQIILSSNRFIYLWHIIADNNQIGRAHV